MRARQYGWPAVLILVGVLAPGVSSAGGVCVLVKSREGADGYRVAPGGRLRLRFTNSVYGSRVEETFAVDPRGLRLLSARYSEARLAEFYGYETARPVDGWWAVEPPPRRLSVLDLRATADDLIDLALDGRTIPLNGARPADGIRLAVGECPDGPFLGRARKNADERRSGVPAGDEHDVR
ncbi:MAG TPA: hypothetical protein VNN77_09125 [candidate division Zixibacteria bacterium]|nr:hypothetical protein [candidate division Zixibacteria bacterium]